MRLNCLLAKAGRFAWINGPTGANEEARNFTVILPHRKPNAMPRIGPIGLRRRTAGSACAGRSWSDPIALSRLFPAAVLGHQRHSTLGSPFFRCDPPGHRIAPSGHQRPALCGLALYPLVDIMGGPAMRMHDWNNYRRASCCRGWRNCKTQSRYGEGVMRHLGGAGAKTGKLDAKTRELIALAVAISLRCDGCITVHTAEARKQGATEEEIAEALGVAISASTPARRLYTPPVLWMRSTLPAKSDVRHENSSTSPIRSTRWVGDLFLRGMRAFACLDLSDMFLFCSCCTSERVSCPSNFLFPDLRGVYPTACSLRSRHHSQVGLGLWPLRMVCAQARVCEGSRYRRDVFTSQCIIWALTSSLQTK